MDRFITWVIFFLCLVLSIWGAKAVLNDLQSQTLKTLSHSDGNQLAVPVDSGPSRDEVAVEMWFESESHEMEAENRLKNSKVAEALSELERAIGTMEQIKRENPEFRPVHVDDRLVKLKQLKELWKTGSGSDSSPESSFRNPPSIDDPAPEVPMMAALVGLPALAESTLDLPELGSPQFGIPRIGSGTSVNEDTASFTKLTNDDPVMRKFLNENPPAPIENLSASGPSPLTGPVSFRDESGPDETSGPVGIGSSDPSSIWYRAFLSAESARELEKKGKLELARRKYEESKTYYEHLNREFPEVESEHIKNGPGLLAERLKKIIEKP